MNAMGVLQLTATTCLGSSFWAVRTGLTSKGMRPSRCPLSPCPSSTLCAVTRYEIPKPKTIKPPFGLSKARKQTRRRPMACRYLRKRGDLLLTAGTRKGLCFPVMWSGGFFARETMSSTLFVVTAALPNHIRGVIAVPLTP